MNHGTCEQIANDMDAYSNGQMERSSCELLFDHILACERCYNEHWLPFRAESEMLMGIFLDSIDPADCSSQNLATVGGTVIPRTVRDWTHTPNSLPKARTILKATAYQPIQVRADYETTFELIGVLLPRLPKRRMVSASWLYLGDGLPRPDETSRTPAILMVDTTSEELNLSVRGADVIIDGHRADVGSSRRLDGYHLVEINGFSYLVHRTAATSSYEIGIGLIRFSGQVWPLSATVVTIGRDEGMDIRLPSRDIRTNLRFDLDAGNQATDVTARESRAPFVLDATEVSRFHATIERKEASRIILRQQAIYPIRVLRSDSCHASTGLQSSVEVGVADEVLVGQSLFRLQDRRSALVH